MTTLRRQMKNVIKNYTEAEVKVREATSNDPWGPSSTLMSEISDLTYNIVALGDIMRMIWKRLNDHGKNWRHVYKSLVLLDYLIKNGNEKVAQQCKEHIVAIQTLKDFQYIEENKDQGANVRDKAKQLVSLLRDDERLKQERIKALKARERYAQNAMGISSDNKITYSTIGARAYTGSSAKGGGNYSDPYGGARGASIDNEYAMAGGNGRVSRNSLPLSPDLEAVRPSDANEEELQMNLALMLSKQEHDEEMQKKRADEAKLQLAIEQSKIETVANQDNGLLDLASGFSASAATNDPWSDNFINSNHQQTHIADPWAGSSAPVPTLQKNSHIVADPWAATTTTTTTASSSNNYLSQLNDPWHNTTTTTTASSKPPPTTNPWNDSKSATNTTSNDPWGATSSSNTDNNVDEFELFSNKRSLTSPQTVQQPDPFGDFFGGSSTTAKASTNPWDDKAEANKTTTQNPTRKTPESFLGENSGLVNLDNLIPTSTTSKNFGPSSQRPNSTNPFGGGGVSTTPVNALQTSNSAGNLLSNSSKPSGAPAVNPFLQQAQKPPSINQLNGNSANLFPSFSTVVPAAPSPYMMPQPTTNNQSPLFMNSTGLYPTFNQQPFMPTTQATTPYAAAAGGTFNQQQSTNPFL